MILVDTALRRRAAENRPIRVGLIGAGYMGRGLALQIITAFPGMVVAAISNRTLEHAERAYRQAGIATIIRAGSVAEVESAISRSTPCVTDQASLLCEAGPLDVIVEATGEVEFGAEVVMAAIRHGKHVVMMNAELDAVVGPILKTYADRAEVVISNIEGDQPGSIMNLFRWVETIGYEPVLAGNIKGLQDHYRTPATQRQFAEQYQQRPKMVTSFADGTKISMEMAVVANATGFGVAARGMLGPECRHVSEAVDRFPEEVLTQGGVVDYILGAEPGPGVFVIGHNEHPIKQQYMQYLKMGDGPFYTFYVPYHLPHLETPITIARAALFGDAAINPLGGPVVEVAAAAKTRLAVGTDIDGIGGFHCYGVAVNHSEFAAGGYLPMSLAEGCRLVRGIERDGLIRYTDVELPADRLADRLRAEQDRHFGQL